MPESQDILLWPDGPAPGSEGLALDESVEDQGTPGDPRRVVRGVLRPSVIPHWPERPNGAAALVIPGGGYTALMVDKEGTDIARWLNALGMAAFVLRHRLPGEGHAEGRHAPLRDARRAMRLIRARAAGWGLDPERLGAVGLSSGAHLAGGLGAAHARPDPTARDAVDHLPARPAFMALAYGPLSGNARDRLIDPAQKPLEPAEKQALYDAWPVDGLIDATTPPAFLVTADDDRRVHPLNSVRVYLALRAAGVPAELHIFRDGGHGFAIRGAAGRPVGAWTALCAAWLAGLGIIPTGS